MEDNEDLFNFDDSSEEQIAANLEEETAANLEDDTQYEDTSDYENITDDSESEADSDYISKLLEAKGIDRNNIQIYDEQGNPSSIKFDDLSDSEKYDLLSEQEPTVLPSDDELQVLNYLRQNGMTLQQFAEWQQQLGVQNYLNGQPQVSDTDQYSDDEIIAYDYIQRFGDEMSDEEIDAEIDRLKGDPEAYQKRVDLLRNAYKSEEAAQAQLYEQQQKEQMEADTADFKNAYITQARNLDDIQGITLDNNDKEELLNFVLTKDAANRTAFSKAMDDPQNVLKMAWYLLHGEETFDATVDYFKQEIAKREKSGPRIVNRQSRTKSSDRFQF